MKVRSSRKQCYRLSTCQVLKCSGARYARGIRYIVIIIVLRFLLLRKGAGKINQEAYEYIKSYFRTFKSLYTVYSTMNSTKNIFELRVLTRMISYEDVKIHKPPHFNAEYLIGHSEPTNIIYPSL